MFKEYTDFMTAKEAMEALGIRKNLMYKLLNTGEVKAVRVTGKCGGLAGNRFRIMQKVKRIRKGTCGLWNIPQAPFCLIF